MSNRMAVQSLDDTKVDNEQQEIVLIKQEVTQWETNYSFLLEDKEATQAELEITQEKLVALQADYDKCQNKFHTLNKNNTVKVIHIVLNSPLRHSR